MDSNESGPDDLLSWDGRKTADFAKVSNDGKWTWDGSEWQPRKKAKKQISTDNQEQDIDVQPQSVPAPKFPKKNEKPVDQTQTTHIGTISPDGRYQWDGGKWVPVELTKLSNDGFWMWDGIDWIPNPSNSAPSEVKQVPMTVSKSSAVSEIYASPNQTPMITVLLRKASGAGYYAMAGHPYDPVLQLSTPITRLAVMEGKTLAIGAFNTKLDDQFEIATHDPQERAKIEAGMKQVEDQIERDMDSIKTAAQMDTDEVVYLRELRGYLTCVVEMCYQASGVRRIKNPRIWSMHDLAVLWKES